MMVLTQEVDDHVDDHYGDRVAHSTVEPAMDA
jgi:hypothetical protein